MTHQKTEFLVVLFEESTACSAWCPDVDVASQGDFVNDAISNPKEALELHVECLTPSELSEVKKRQGQRLITTLEVPVTG